jgi:hypothetical protein
VYGQDTPREFRNGNTIAADIYVGFEGARPGTRRARWWGARGAYGSYPTHGGFDQMTARVVGLWDSPLAD